MRKIRYSLGQVWAYQDVSVTFDPEDRQFVFTQIRSETQKGKSQPKLALVRRDAISSRCFYGKNLSVEDITGLADPLEELPIQQLMLPLFISPPQSDVVVQEV
jgi:hypothetical protein